MSLAIEDTRLRVDTDALEKSRTQRPLTTYVLGGGVLGLVAASFLASPPRVSPTEGLIANAIVLAAAAAFFVYARIEDQRNLIVRVRYRRRDHEAFRLLDSALDRLFGRELAREVPGGKPEDAEHARMARGNPERLALSWVREDGRRDDPFVSATLPTGNGRLHFLPDGILVDENGQAPRLHAYASIAVRLATTSRLVRDLPDGAVDIPDAEAQAEGLHRIRIETLALEIPETKPLVFQIPAADIAAPLALRLKALGARLEQAA